MATRLPPPPLPPPSPTELKLGRDFVDGILQLGQNGSGISADATTFTVFFRGPQTSGTLKSFPITRECWLIRVQSAGTITVGRNATAFPIGGGLSYAFAACAGVPTTVGIWEGKEHFSVGETLYFDSIGSLGTSECCVFTFLALDQT